MTWLRLVQTRVSAIWRTEEIQDRIAEDLRFHIAMRTREYIEQGMSPREAGARARRRFGNLNAIKDAGHDVLGGGWLETMWIDLRFAARMLRKDRAFTLVVVLVLALTIGASAAVFTIVNGVLWRPLPFHDSGRLVSIWSSDAAQISRIRVSQADFETFKAENQWFDSLAAFSAAEFVLRTETTEASRVRGFRVSSNIFALLRVSPQLGRTFEPADEHERDRPPAVISHHLWQRNWNGAADVIGAALEINGRMHRVVGVMSPEFRFPFWGPPERVWTTEATHAEAVEDGGVGEEAHRRREWQLFGRLKPGVSEKDARSGLTSVAARLAAEHPASNSWVPASDVAPLLDGVTQHARPQLLLLFGAALCVLGVGCANVANLLLARGAKRQQEFAVRSALGAGRGRLLRQLLTESLLLSAIGALAGSATALALTRYMVAVLPEDFPRAAELGPDVSILLFTAAATLVTTCLFGLVPAWHCAPSGHTLLVSGETERSTATARARRASSLLVACEIVLAFVLLAGAGFLLRGLWHLQNIPTGFNAENLQTTRLSLAPNTPGADTVAAYERLLRRVTAIKQVSSASIASSLPLIGRREAADLEFADRAGLQDNRAQVFASVVAPQFFRTMGIGIVRGRDFDARQRTGSAGVSIITESLARKYYPNQDPLGKRLKATMSSDPATSFESEIIGVVKDVKFGELAREAHPAVFFPLAQGMRREMNLVIRTSATPAQVFRGLRAAAVDIADSLLFSEPVRFDEYVAALLAQPRLNSNFLGGYAALAVLLAAIGVYGVTSYSVAQRRREIGIRLVLGASRSAVCRLVVGQALRVLLLAMPAGVLCALLARYLLRGFLYPAGMMDAPVVLLVGLVVVAVVLAASWIPARAAMQIDPVVALRRE